MRINGVFQFTQFDLDIVDQVIQYLNKHYRQNISAEHLAVEFGLEIKKLRAGIKKRTHSTIHKYLLKIRVEKIKEDLTDQNLSIKQIAAKNGFKDVSQMGKLFKKHTSKTPLQYRQEQILYV